MRAKRRGFTLIELMIVITIIAIIASIAIPNLLESRKMANERTASATMKQLHTAQEMFREKVHKDMDGDEYGEYAWNFAELTGDNAANTLQPVGQGISLVNMVPSVVNWTRSEKNGYVYEIRTPASSAAGWWDDDETCYCVLAWPKKWDKTGVACFGMTEEGQIWTLDNAMQQHDDSNTLILQDLYGNPFQNRTLGTGAEPFKPAK